jgi:hypothetical protein
MIKFKDFLEKTDYQNHWVLGPRRLRLYVRRTYNNPEWKERYGDIQIANCHNPRPGQGEMSEFLDEWEGKLSIYFENVINLRFEEYLRKRNYALLPSSTMTILPCYIKRVK